MPRRSTFSSRLEIKRYNGIKSPLRRALRFEPLEERRLLSVTVDLVSKAEFPSLSAGGESLTDEGSWSADGRYLAFVSDATNLVAGFNLTPGITNVYRFDRLTGEILLVSVDATGTGSGSDDSIDPVISADGTIVAFESDAANLHALDTNDERDVFARNLATGTTYLVSIDVGSTNAGDSGSFDPVISADGNIVAFESYASNLHALDTDDNADIFVRNLATNTTQLVSINTAGTGSGDRSSFNPVMSANGNVVAFYSDAENLHGLDTNNFTDIFARNLSTNTTHLVSINAAGTGSGDDASYDPVISADGSVIAFESNAGNLHVLDTNSFEDVFARNLETNTTHLVSINAAGTGSGDDDSSDPVISADGSVVAFESYADNLHALDTNAFSDVFARNLSTSTTHLVSTNATGSSSGNDYSFNPVISADGAVVAFGSEASDLHPLDNNIETDIFARNLTSGTTYLLSIDSTGTGSGNDDSFDALLSADGSTVAFASDATNFANGDSNGESDVFTHEIGAGASQLVTRAHIDLLSVTAGGYSDVAAVSADGRYVVFESDAPNLVSGIEMAPEVTNIYRMDRATGEVVLVSIGVSGNSAGDDSSYSPSISADGNIVAFYSHASNLHALDTNDHADIFVRNLTTNTTHLVSINTAGTAGGNGDSFYPVLSADGNVVAYHSYATNLHPLDTDDFADVFARNLTTGTTHLVSINAAGTSSGDYSSDSPAISANGQIIAFRSSSSDLHPLDSDFHADIFVRDLDAEVTHLVSPSASGTSSGNANSRGPVISADGSIVVYESFASNLHALDTNGFSDIFARNWKTGTTHLVSINASGTNGGNGYSYNPVISADGSVVAFESYASNLHAFDTDTTLDVFAYELVSGTTELISVDVSGTSSSDNDSYGPAISADGNIVAFASYAANVHALDPTDLADVFVRDRNAGTTELVSIHANGSRSGNLSSLDLAISPDGSVVAFDSWASDLVEGDLNSATDVFVATFTAGPEPPELPGDYNRSGTVDAADYVAWRRSLTAQVDPYSGADGDGDGTVADDDFNVWRAHFGETELADETGAGAVSVETEREPAALATSDSASNSPTLVDARATAHAWAQLGAISRPVLDAALSSSVPALATHRDDALLAWLAARPQLGKRFEAPELAAHRDESIDAGGVDDVMQQIDDVMERFALPV